MRKIWFGLLVTSMLGACSREAPVEQAANIKLQVERALEPLFLRSRGAGALPQGWRELLDYNKVQRSKEGLFWIPWLHHQPTGDSTRWAALVCMNDRGRPAHPLLMEYKGRSTAVDVLSMNIAFGSEKGAADGKYRLIRPDGRLVSERQYRNGNLITEKHLRSGKPAGSGRGQARSRNCLDWYEITTSYYSDGRVEVFEVYLGTTCEGCSMFDIEVASMQCSSSESGGGSSGEDCTIETDEMKGQGTSEPTKPSFTYVSSRQRQVDCSWTFYRNYFNIWSFLSLEIGEQQYVRGKWVWKAFRHVGISQEGGTIGITVSCDILNAHTSFNEQVASVELNFKVTKSVFCKGFPIMFYDTGVQWQEFMASNS